MNRRALLAGLLGLLARPFVRPKPHRWDVRLEWWRGFLADQRMTLRLQRELDALAAERRSLVKSLEGA